MQAGFAYLTIATLSLMLATPTFARGPWRADALNTPGWQLMTPEERIEHQATVRSFTSYDECQVYQASHHQLMEERAKQRNVTLLAGGWDFCTHLKPAQASMPHRD